MNAVDAAILVSVVLVACLGWRDGLVRAVFGVVGLMLGTAAGIALAPRLLQSLELSVWVAIAAPGIVVLGAVAGRFTAVWIEKRLRSWSRFEPDKRVDRPAGAALGILATLSVSWMLGVALAGSTLPGPSEAANRSTVLGALNRAHLPLSHYLARQFVSLSDKARLPRYVDVFLPERIAKVAPPPRAVATAPGVMRASESTWRIIATGESLLGAEGTGFLVAPGRLMTAAHVVDKGVELTIDTADGPLSASIVACDPKQDVAVLAVPGLSGRVLSFGDGDRGDVAVVIGFPDNGPLTLTPARVRERLEWQSSDIHGDGRYTHDAYTIRGRVIPGNSGGPLVTPDGRVLGVVVAASRADAHTGYVLARAQVTPTLEAGLAASPRSTTTCR